MMRTKPTHRGRTRERGFAMVAVLLVMGLMMGMNAALHGGILSDTRLRGAHAGAITGFYAAEAGINRGMAENVNVFRSYNQPTDFTQHSFTLGSRTVKYQLQPVAGYESGLAQEVPAGMPFAGLNSIHYRYTAQATSERAIGDSEVNLGTEFDVNYIPLFQFLAFYQNDLEILPGPTMTVHGPIHTNGSLYLSSNNTFTISDNIPWIQRVSVTAAGDVWRGRKDTSACGGTVRISKLTTTANHTTPLPLQNMNCSGGNRVKQTDAQLATWLGSIKQRVPTIGVPPPSVVNRGTGDFWLNADLRIVLNLTSLTAGGLPSIEVQTAGGAVDGTLTARLQQFMLNLPGRISYNDIPTDNPASPGLASSYNPDFSSNALVYPCPRTSIIGLCSSANYWANCDGAGAPIGAACAAFQDNTAPSGVGSDTPRRGGFYNNRELRWVRMLNLNLHDLLQWNRLQVVGNRLFDPDDTTDGGIVIFLSVQGPLSTTGPVAANDEAYGVRLFGTPNFDFPPPGATDPTGVTIASDQAAYIEGDYNVDVGHGLYDATHPKMPAAIMADAINVLSQNWSGATTSVMAPATAFACRNDCQSRSVLASRPTRATTINAAFLGGVDTTIGGTSAAPGVYNGGLENYPRFHESWSGVALNYRGSFVSLGTALRSFGTWCGTGSTCNIYNAPNRFWDFDSTFQTVAWLPPLTPRVLSVQQILFTENFR
jgi:hypothetical protein